MQGVGLKGLSDPTLAEGRPEVVIKTSASTFIW